MRRVRETGKPIGPVARDLDQRGRTDDTDHRIDGTCCAGIIRRAGPRTGPRGAAGNTL